MAERKNQDNFRYYVKGAKIGPLGKALLDAKVKGAEQAVHRVRNQQRSKKKPKPPQKQPEVQKKGVQKEMKPDYYPEHEKLAKVKDHSQIVGEFMEWLKAKKKVQLTCWTTNAHGEDILVPFQQSTQELLAEFFEIDLMKLEAEKKQMLQKMRELQN